MTPPNLLTELAERVEKLTGPCRGTDCLIFEMGHRLLTPERRGTIDGEPTGEYFNLNGDQLPERASAYTASLDAAMTLVPEGWGWSVGAVHGPSEKYAGSSRAWAEIWTRDNDNGNVDIQIPEMFWDGYRNLLNAASPALALAAASLRARASMESGNG